MSLARSLTEGFGIAVVAVTGQQSRRLRPAPGCSYDSVAYSGSGLVLGETCDIVSNNPRSALVQLSTDMRTEQSRRRLDTCSADPKVTASGDQRQVLLVSSYVFCPGPHSVPKQRVEVLQGGHLRTVHDYVAPGEFLEGATW